MKDAALIVLLHGLTMEAVSSFVTSVSFYQTTWHDIPEDSRLRFCRRENLKCHVVCYRVLLIVRAEAQGSIWA
jgi:hypothetical protein